MNARETIWPIIARYIDCEKRCLKTTCSCLHAADAILAALKEAGYAVRPVRMSETGDTEAHRTNQKFIENMWNREYPAAQEQEEG